MQAMTIEDVLKATGGTLLSGDIHQTFNDVISDSRKVTAGVLFVPPRPAGSSPYRRVPDRD